MVFMPGAAVEGPIELNPCPVQYASQSIKLNEQAVNYSDKLKPKDLFF